MDKIPPKIFYHKVRRKDGSSIAMTANQDRYDGYITKSCTCIRQMLPLNPEKVRIASELHVIQKMRSNKQNAPNPGSRGKRAFTVKIIPPFTEDTDLRLLIQSICAGINANPDKKAAQWAIVNRLKNGESPGEADTAHGPPDFRLSGRCYPVSRNAPRLCTYAGYPAVNVT